MLTHKNAIITGGSRGIGAAITRKLSSLGANVAVICSSNLEQAQAVCDECSEAFGVKALAYRCNVADFDQTRQTVARIKEDFGSVEILVNDAGITRDGLVARMKEEDFDAVLAVNLKGAFHMIRHCTGLFLRQREGCIINISSVVGLTGNPGQANYASSKAGLIGLTKSVAKELGSKGIRCNAIAPGFIQTDMTRELADSPLLKTVPLGAMGRPEDVAEAAAYLAQAGYVTGEVLRVDGGLAM